MKNEEGMKHEKKESKGFEKKENKSLKDALGQKPMMPKNKMPMMGGQY